MAERVLLVEGKDDLHVMQNLFMVRGIPEPFVVETPNPSGSDEDSGGVERLLESIPTRLRTADLERLAVVIDGNDNPIGRWQAVRQRLADTGVNNIPQVHSDSGTVVDLLLPPEPRRPIRFGAWIMPDNRSKGMIEDFVARMIREDDDMLPVVDGFLESIPEKLRRFSPAHRPKARIHTWLAVQEGPGKPMGLAIGAKKYLDTNKKAVQPFLDWVTNVLITDGDPP